eukprot:COSAG06_NODE_7448_length_2501_cov_2.592423_2_plen_378_part_00
MLGTLLLLAVLQSARQARAAAWAPPRAPPTFDDFWEGDACWRTDIETVGGSFTGRQFIVDAPDGSGEVWDYTTVANKTSAGTSYNCVVLFRSTDRGRSFAQFHSSPGSELPCLVPDPSDIVQQQYPAVAPLPQDGPEYSHGQRLVMVYETGGANFYRTSADGLKWSNKTHVAETGACQADATGLPFERKHCGGCASDNRTVLRGAPPGIFLDRPSGELYHLLNTGACPGSMSCLRGKSMSDLSLCKSNPLFVGGTTQNQSHAFDYHFTSGAQLLHTTEAHYYLSYQGEGEVQWWRAGLARVKAEHGIDSARWEKYNTTGEWFDPGHNGGNRTYHTQEGSLPSVWKDRDTNITYRYYRRSRKIGSGRDVLEWCNAEPA